MTETPAPDRSVTIGRDAVNSVITSGDGNSVVVYQTIMGAATPLAAGRNPYLGLLAFTEADADRFFGREKLVAELWTRFNDLMTAPPDRANERFLAILGPSGSGKSSVARAGLLAELARRPVGGKRQRVAVLTPGDQPLRALAAVLARVATNDPAPVAKTEELLGVLQAQTDGVHDGLRRIAASLGAPAEPLVILVDQFEEIYSLCRDAPQRKAFIETLLNAAANPAGDVGVIVTLRTDFLGATQADSALNQVIARQSVIVPSMSGEEVRRAIAEPAARAGHPLDEDTIRRLVAETEGREGALPLLQFVLVRAWEGMEKGVTAATTVDALGGVGGALGAEAERIFTELSPDEQIIAQRAFLAMVRFNESLRPTRRRALLSQLVADDEAIADELELAQTRAVVDRFAQPGSRLVTLSATADGDQTVEVSHEAIFQHWERLKAWLADGMDDIRLHMRVAEAATLWEGAGRPDGSLWRPPDLDLLRGLAAKPTAGLTSVERAFCHASDAAHTREVVERRRRERWVRIAAAVLLVLTIAAGGAGWLALQQSAKAGVQRANAFASAARQAIDAGDSGLALLLSLAAIPPGKEDTDGYRQASAAMRSALLNLAETRDLPHPAAVGSAQFVDSDRRVLTWAQDLKARLWDTQSGRLLKTIYAFQPVTASPDGRSFATFGPGNQVRLWGSDTGALRSAIPGSGEPKSASFSADGKRIAIAWVGRPTGVWNVDSGGQLAQFGPWNAPWADAVAFSPTGREVVTGRSGQGAQVWDAVTGVRRGAPLYSGGVIPEAASTYSQDGRRLAIGDMDSQDQQILRLWDTGSRRLIRAIAQAGQPAFSPDGAHLLAVDPFGEAHIFQTGTGQMLDGTLRHDNGFVTSARYMADGHQIVTAGSDHTAQLWNTDSGVRADKPLAGHIGTVNTAQGSNDGRLVVTASEDRTARIWRTVAGPSWTTEPDYSQAVADRIMARPGPRIMTHYPTGLTIWDGANGRALKVYPPAANLISAALSPDGLQLAGSDGQNVQIVNPANGVKTGELREVGKGFVSTVVFSADSKRIATGFANGTAQVWDAASGGRVGKALVGHKGPVGMATFSPDGARLVTGGADRTARVWDLGSGKSRVLHGHNGPVGGAWFSHKGDRVLTLGNDGTIRQWSADTGALLATISARGAEAALYSNDDRLILAYDLNTLYLWDAATGQPLTKVFVPSEILAAAWSTDGRRIIVLSGDGTMTADPQILFGRALRTEACRRAPRDFTTEERGVFGLGRSVTGCTAKAGWLRRLGLGAR